MSLFYNALMFRNGKFPLVYVTYLTLGVTLPFILPAHITQKTINNTSTLGVKGRSNPRCLFARLI
ncbi:hypothetical protein HG535_0A05540 [Zygotorulaspora mrakii]|uniref:Uncharacterized protein n=1 Tax=Zygotorulaspora mrakii TaxID=42260 RepID=A0A7H9AWK9_ZYGMR|nr:uncharacterized protein HG535_0A05540 [Zygotorulaspora mrakii]QLG70613.1 hypothetical protein HG535_0A05540 [Zygotorulaspora mrakii]